MPTDHVFINITNVSMAACLLDCRTRSSKEPIPVSLISFKFNVLTNLLRLSRLIFEFF